MSSSSSDGGKRSEALGEDFLWRWRDPGHLEAHRAEFYLDPESVLEMLRPLVAPLRPRRKGEGPAEAPGLTRLHEDFELPAVVGESGLREVDPEGSQSFWAYRRGRSIPSHVCLGERAPTRFVCLWGEWDADAFVIHTLYPGLRAPREIHDPELTLSDLPVSIEFWRNHAIITQEGSYSRDPH